MKKKDFEKLKIREKIIALQIIMLKMLKGITFLNIILNQEKLFTIKLEIIIEIKKKLIKINFFSIKNNY